jgi:dolichyl-phosphate-mannose-protein mannosyltransferase
VAAVGLNTRTDGLRLALSRWGILFALAAGVGVVLRVWIYRSAMGVPNSDEAVVALMARHILDGEFTTFFWGQAYGGSQEALLTAPLFAVSGSSWLAARLVPIVLTAVAALVVWRVGRRTIGEPAAAVAGALLWIWPPYVGYYLIHSYGFYGTNLLYCALVLLLALRIVERPDTSRIALFGLVLGLAFWQTAQIIPIALPVIAWTIWRQPRCLRRLWVALPFFALGALPWIVWNFRHDWGSFHPPDVGDTSYAHRLRLFASPLLPMMLGLRIPFTQEPLPPGLLTVPLYVVLVLLFGYAAYRGRRRDVSLLYVVAAVFPFVYALSGQTLNSKEPRYLIVLAPVLALIVAQLATTYWRAVAVLAVGCAISIGVVHQMHTYFRETALPLDLPMAPRDLGPLIRTLDSADVRHVYATYWLAYRLAFDTHERIVATPAKFAALRLDDGRATLAPNPFVDYPRFEREVDASRHAFVLFRDTVGGYPVVRKLAGLGYERRDVGPFAVWLPPPEG